MKQVPSWRFPLTATLSLVLALGLGAWDPARASAEAGHLRTELRLVGDVPLDAQHEVSFEGGHVGQTLFTICGGDFAPPCKARLYVGDFGQFPVGTTFTYAFRVVGSAGQPTTYFSGTAVVGEVELIRAEFRYGSLPDTAIGEPPAPSAPWPALGVGAAVVGSAHLLSRRRRRDRLQQLA